MAILLGVGCTLVLILLTWLVYSTDSLCGNKILPEVLSPDGLWKVVTFERDCGATTGFSTQVSVLKASEALGNEPGNLFVADSNHGAAPAGSGGGPEIRIEWVSPTEIQLSHHKDARVFKANEKIGLVRVVYEKRAN